MNHTYLLIHLLCAFVSLALIEFFFNLDQFITEEFKIEEENIPAVRVFYILVNVILGPIALIMTLWDIKDAYTDDDDDDTDLQQNEK